MASSKLPPSQLMNATSTFWPSASSPSSVDELSASGCRAHALPRIDDRALVDAGALVGAHELAQAVACRSSPRVRHRTDDRVGGRRSPTAPSPARGRRPGPSRARCAPPCRCRPAALGLEQRHGLALHVRAHQRAVGVVVLEERDQRGRHRHDLLGGDVHVVDLLGRPRGTGRRGGPRRARRRSAVRRRAWRWPGRCSGPPRRAAR